MADVNKNHINHNGSEEQQQTTKKTVTNQPVSKQEAIKGEGVKCAIHGVFYQLKLVVVVLLHAKQLLNADNSIQFKITSEDPYAGKFDDVVFRFWTTSGPQGTVKIQAKHKIEHSDKLTWTDLKANIKAPFAIVKYFRSFLEQEDLAPIEKDQFVLCTNAKIDKQLLAMLEKVHGLNDMVDPIFDTIDATHYRFNLDKLADHTEFQKLLQQMEECSDIVCLAKVLANHVFKKQEVTVNEPLLAKYRKAIISILDIDPSVENATKRKDFTKAFLEGSTLTTPIGMMEFREAFRIQYRKLLPNVSDQLMWDDVQKKGIEVTKRYMKQHDNSQADAFPSNVAIDVKIKQFFNQFLLSCNTLHEQLLDKPIQNLWRKTMQRNDNLLFEQIGNIEKELAYKELFGEIFKWLGNTEGSPLARYDIEKLLCTIRISIHLLYLKGISHQYCRILKKQELVVDPKSFKYSPLYAEIGSISSEKSKELESGFIFISPYRTELTGSFILSVLELWHQDHPFEYLIFDEATFLNIHKCLLEVFISLNSPLAFAVVCENFSDTMLKLDQFVDVNQSSCRRNIILCGVMKPYIPQNIPDEAYLKIADLCNETKELLKKKYHTLAVFDTLVYMNKVIKDDDSLLMLTTALEEQIQQKKHGSFIETAFSKQQTTYISRNWEPYVERQERAVDLVNNKVEFQKLAKSFEEEIHVTAIVPALHEAFLKNYQEDIFLLATKDIERVLKTKCSIPCEDDQAGLIDNSKNPDEPKQKRKVFILLNEAGQGKSSYLTWLGAVLKEKVPSTWIIRLNCIEYCTDFERLLQNGKQQSVEPLKALRVLFVLIHLALFVPTINKKMISDTDLERRKAGHSAECIAYTGGKVILNEKQMERLYLSFDQRLLLRVFQYKFNNLKMVLLVDGFDEIAPHYKSVVLGLLKHFEIFPGIAKMYIASRAYNFKQSFETCFQRALFFQLPMLSFIEKALMMYTLMPPVDAAWIDTDNWMLIMMTVVITYSLQQLSDVPLFLRLGVEEYFPLIEKYINITTYSFKKALFEDIDVIFDKLRLMKKFIERKISIAIVEKPGIIDAPLKTPALKNMMDNMIAMVEARHNLLAVWAMFSEKNCKLILPTEDIEAIKRFMKEILEGNDKTGIVESVQDNTPIFVHRLFAEYFAAQWIVEHQKRNPKRASFFIYNEYWQQEQVNMRRFIDTILLGNSEKYPLHMAVIEGDETKIKAILRARPDSAFQKDPKARTILHLAALYPVSEDVLDLFPNKVEQNFINAAEGFYSKSALTLAFLMDNEKMIWYCLCHRPLMNIAILHNQMTWNKDRIISQVGRYDFHVTSYVYQHGLHETDAGKSTLASMTELCDKVIQTMVNKTVINFYDPEYVGGREKETLLERLVRLDAVLLLKSFVKNAGGLQNLHIDIDQLFQKALETSAFFVMEYLICEGNVQVPKSTKEGKLMRCIEAGKKNKDSAIYKMLVKEFCDEHRLARLSMEK